MNVFLYDGQIKNNGLASNYIPMNMTLFWPESFIKGVRSDRFRFCSNFQRFWYQKKTFFQFFSH